MFCRFATRSLCFAARRAVACSLTSAAIRWQSTEAQPNEGAKKEEAPKQEAAKQPKEQPKENPLIAKCKQLEEDLAKSKKDLLYMAAEAENARRIGREDTAKARDFGMQSFGKDMLEIADVLEKASDALETVPKEVIESQKSLQSISTGFKMCVGMMTKCLGKNGITKMDVKAGTTFDSKLHDALFNAPANDKVKAGQVSAVVKNGYLIKDRVLRAAQVGVAQ